MKTENIIYPLDPIAIVHCLETLPGGVSLAVKDYGGDTISVGIPVYKKDKKYYPVKGGKLYEEAKKDSLAIKLQKGSYVFKEGDQIDQGIKVKKVDTSDKSYDKYELEGKLSADYAKGSSLYLSPPLGAEWAGVSIATVVKEKPHVGLMLRGTLNKEAVPFILKEEDKKKLPLILYHSR